MAEANLSIRLAPGQEVDEIAPAVERLLRDALPAGAELEIERWSSARRGSSRPTRGPSSSASTRSSACSA